MNPEATPVALTVLALHRAMDDAERWASTDAGITQPFEGLDEDLFRSFVRSAAAGSTRTDLALIFGLHVGAALARQVDDPCFGLPTVDPD